MQSVNSVFLVPFFLLLLDFIISMGKESACSAGDTGDEGLMSGLGRSPEGGNVNPLQYSCPENPMDKGAKGP